MAERRRRGGEAADGRRPGATGGARRDDESVDDEAVLDDEVFDDDSVIDDPDDVVDADDETEAEQADGATPRRRLSRSGQGTATKARPKSADAAGKKAGKGKATERVGIFARLLTFVREVVAELRKVIWPTRNELLTYTTVVVVFVTIMLSIVGLLDYGFGKLVLWVFGGKTMSGS